MLVAFFSYTPPLWGTSVVLMLYGGDPLAGGGSHGAYRTLRKAGEACTPYPPPPKRHINRRVSEFLG